jgi:hypothetical protein
VVRRIHFLTLFFFTRLLRSLTDFSLCYSDSRASPFYHNRDHDLCVIPLNKVGRNQTNVNVYNFTFVLPAGLGMWAFLAFLAWLLFR